VNYISRTVYADLDDIDEDGWIIDGPDAAAMFTRWLGKDAIGCTLAVLLDHAYRVIGCDVVASNRMEASRLTGHSVLRHVQKASAKRFILTARPKGGDFLPTRRQAVVARIIGLSANLNNTPMVDHIIVGNRGYWSAWAQSAVDW
jgi:DNA repair protein RadC